MSDQSKTNEATSSATSPESAKKNTAKSKAALGISEDRIIVWVPFDVDASDHGVLSGVAKGRKSDMRSLLTPPLREWLEANRVALTEEAGEHAAKTELTPEQVQAQIDAANRKLERLKAKLNGNGK